MLKLAQFALLGSALKLKFDNPNLTGSEQEEQTIAGQPVDTILRRYKNVNKLVGVTDRNQLMGAYDLNQDGEASKAEFETLLGGKVN